jgi:UDP-glucose 4-epimerase
MKGMTRFFMTLDESVDLIEKAIRDGKSGDLWIPRLRSATIDDLAAIFSRRFGKPVSYIGIRPGEKIHENLVNAAESIRVVRDGLYYIVRPPMSNMAGDVFEFTSNDMLISQEELETFLIANKVFDGVEEL